MRGIAWTPERIEQLTKLWLEGYSATEIAKIMQLGSRNSVIGKVHRLGIKRDLPATPSGLRQPKKHKQPRKNRKGQYRSNWTHEMDVQLRTLFAQGLSDRAIADRMEPSHSSITKRRHKLGLKAKKARPKPKRAYITDRAKAIAEANRNTQGLTIMDLGPRQCRFGTNDPKPGHLHLFCGQKTPAGQSYCEAHAAIVYRAEEDVG